MIHACSDNEWKLLFALSRFGGLRCPSEHLALTWDDLDWERGRLTIHAPKLEHLGDEFATRQIPIFPELRPYLETALDEAAEGATFIVTRRRGANCNLRTQMQRIVKQAGLKPWPKLFHNLRATRRTELAKLHPMHLNCAWIGNSPAVAKKHYLQVTDADFADAQKTAPNAAHKVYERGCAEGSCETTESKNPEELAMSAISENDQCSLMD
nr:site-specific integrase [Pirellulales bacterium]